MAEQEIAKATKKIVDTAKSKEQNTAHKMKEIAMEIAVIVFAVSLSIAFHNWSETRHEHKEAKAFLIGLRKDLRNDAKELKQDMISYQNQKKLFTYLANIPEGQKADSDSIKAYQEFIFKFTGFEGNSGRYEGFKSSGKFGYIEDDNLQNDILDLYEEDIPTLTISTDFYKNQKLKFFDDITNNTIGYPDGNFTEVLANNSIKNRSRIYLSNNVNQILQLYQDCLGKIEKIQKQINHHYPEKK